MGFRFVSSAFGRLLNMIQASPKRFVDNRLKRCAQLGRNGSGAFQYIIINCECRSHKDIIASSKMMSRHQLRHFFDRKACTVYTTITIMKTRAKSVAAVDFARYST